MPLVAATLLAGCTGSGPDDAATSASPSGSPSTSPTAAATPDATLPAVDAAPDAAPDAPAGGPEDSFRTWLAASRAPDVETACAYMTPALADRMVAEISAQGFPGVTDCASLITLTAGLFAAATQTSQTAVELREQADDRAVLHVTYVEGSSCGLVVLRPGDGHWVLDERSKEEC